MTTSVVQQPVVPMRPREEAAMEIHSAIPDRDGRWGRGYRTAIESMTLALKGAGISDDTIAEAVATALDAYGNHNDDHSVDAEVHDLLIVSTGHLSPAEREVEWLERVFSPEFADPEVLDAWSGCGIVVSFTAEWGCQLYVEQRNEDTDPASLYERLYPQMSVGLTGVIRRAVALGCEYVRFDSDADPLPGVVCWEDSPEAFGQK